MPFCTINGFNIPIEDRAAGRDLDLIGRPKRSITGTGEGSFFTSKRTFNLKTPVVENADFLAYQGLVNGEGHVMPLQENAFTADGIGAESGTANFTATSNKFDGGDYYLTSSNPDPLKWSGDLLGHTNSDDFTVCWVTSDSPSGHAIFAKTGTGHSVDLQYLNGSPGFGADFSNVQIYGIASVAGIYVLPQAATITERKQFHEIVYLPFKLNAAQMAAITARTKRFSALPYITVSGDMVDGETVTCTGTSGTSDFVPSSFSGTFGANNRLSFTLQEK